MSNMYTAETVRFALVRLFFERYGFLPKAKNMEEIEEIVKYIYQSK